MREPSFQEITCKLVFVFFLKGNLPGVESGTPLWSFCVPGQGDFHCQALSVPTLQLNFVVWKALFFPACGWKFWTELGPANNTDGVLGYYGSSAADVQWPASDQLQGQGSPPEQGSDSNQPGSSGQAGLPNYQGKTIPGGFTLQVKERVILHCNCDLRYLPPLFIGFRMQPTFSSLNKHTSPLHPKQPRQSP